MDQGQCGNCWAVATTSMINDRLCMHTGEQKYYSPKLLTCKRWCLGGNGTDVVNEWRDNGLIEESCQAFPNEKAIKAICNNETCPVGCDDKSKNLTLDLKSYGGYGFVMANKTDVEIMNEIYYYGPVAAYMKIYDDFMHCYGKGIYKFVAHPPKERVAHHLVKLYGWGVENGIKYWMVVNSWGENWGENGLFRIQRGNNDCQIESDITVAVPKESMAPSIKEKR